jgi:hypothetical protein
MLIIVTIKLIAPAILLTPAIWSAKIPRSTPGPECAVIPLNGGYSVQPVPTPAPMNEEPTKKYSAHGNNQNDRLLSRGNAISGAPSKIGTIQLPKPPINTGITMKKIMISACDVTKTLYSWLLPKNTLFPGWANSRRMKTDRVVPMMPLKAPKTRYKIAMRL